MYQGSKGRAEGMNAAASGGMQHSPF